MAPLRRKPHDEDVASESMENQATLDFDAPAENANVENPAPAAESTENSEAIPAEQESGETAKPVVRRR